MCKRPAVSVGYPEAYRIVLRATGSAVAIASGNLKSFKTEFQALSAALSIANQSITAFSPVRKAI